jgi:hypothetical protein
MEVTTKYGSQGLQFLNLNRLKLIDLPNRYNNIARLNLEIDRFQVNNEYSRDGMRTEQIHIEMQMTHP